MHDTGTGTHAGSAAGPALGVAAGLTALDADPGGHLRFLQRAIELGYGRIWLPETFQIDPVALAGWLTAAHPGHPLGVGVLPAALRSGPQLAMLASTLSMLGVAEPVVALGTSSAVMTRRWHGRAPTTVTGLAALVAEARLAASGARTEGGFVNGLGAVPLQVHLAALGPRTLRLAGRVADGVALNFVGPAALPALLAEIDEGAAEAGRARPVVTVWTHVTVSPDERDVRATRRWLAPYLSIPGYDRVLRLQGFGAQVERAQRDRLHPVEAAELIDDEVLAVVAGFGSALDARRRIDGMLAQGVQVALLAGAVRPGAASARTLEALAPVTGGT